MKNIFRKAVQKVRNTAANVFYTIQENPALGVAAAGVVLMLGGTIYKVLKTEPVKTSADIPFYNVEAVLKAVQNAHDAFKAGHEAEPDTLAVNLAKYGFTKESAWMLSQLGLCEGPDAPKSAVHLYYYSPEEPEGATFLRTEWESDADA
jgi:hypothetical protein